MMNENEMKLIGIIRESDDPGKAMLIAVEVIKNLLVHLESSEGPELGIPVVPSGTTQ